MYLPSANLTFSVNFEGVKKPQRHDKMKRYLLLKYKIKIEQENLNHMFMRKELASKTTGPLKMSLSTRTVGKCIRLGPFQISLRTCPQRLKLFFSPSDGLLPN